MSRNKLQEEGDRDYIRRVVAPIEKLAAIANGHPLVRYDWEGAPVEYRAPTLEHQLKALDTLAKKTLPDLKSVDITNEGGGMTIVFDNAIPLPNSQSQSVEVNKQQAIEQMTSVAHQIEDAIIVEDDDE